MSFRVINVILVTSEYELNFFLTCLFQNSIKSKLGSQGYKVSSLSLNISSSCKNVRDSACSPSESGVYITSFHLLVLCVHVLTLAKFTCWLCRCTSCLHFKSYFTFDIIEVIF